MTRKDCELIAASIRAVLERDDRAASEGVLIALVRDMSDRIALDNPAFKAVTFKKACGL